MAAVYLALFKVSPTAAAMFFLPAASFSFVLGFRPPTKNQRLLWLANMHSDDVALVRSAGGDARILRAERKLAYAAFEWRGIALRLNLGAINSVTGIAYFKAFMV